MDPRKILAQAFAIVAVLSILPFGRADAFTRELDCTNFTSFRYVNQMKMIDDTLFVATSGGLLAITDPSTKPGMYRNLDGLGTNDITDVMVDGDGQIWLAGFGRLIKYDGKNSQQFLFFDYDNNLFSLRRLVDDGNDIWVGAEDGLVLFSKTNDGGQIQDSYTLFGNLNSSPMVNDIMLTNDTIWIATSSGLAVADRTDPLLLKSPASWVTFNLGNHPELGQDSIMQVTEYESNVYIANSRGFYRMDINAGTGDTVFTQMLLGAGSRITDLKVENDTLFFYGSLGCGYLTAGGVSTYSISGVSGSGLTGFNTGSYRWIASASGGIYQNSSGTFRSYPYIGTPGNNVTDIATTRDGRLFGGFFSDQSAELVDSSWVRITPGNRVSTRLLVDSSDNVWFGTEGGGLYYLDGSTLKHYDQTNTPMIGNSDNPPFGLTYVINTDIATDGHYLYTTCYRAINGFSVVIADLDSLDNRASWDSLGIPNGLSDAHVTSIAINDGLLAVGNESDGLYLANIGPKVVPDSIQFQHIVRANSGLISDNVRIVRYAPDGTLWVGTNFGISRYDIGGTDRFGDVPLPAGISSNINDIEFDGRGNAWIGTRNGLGFRDGVTGEVTVFNTLNSDISGDLINSVTVDHNSGWIYVGTNSGFTLTPGIFGPPVNSVNEVVAFPNPFVISSPDDRVSFNLNKTGTLRIFTVAGELIRQMPLAAWDGRNDRGKEVASGVYLFVIRDVDGNVGKGKLLLIRR
jgi:ligand-binding sensor domain-containing protein